LRHCRLMRNIY